jgi:heme/copper-type cytochrome/quinol oxidase subunit 2
MGSVTGVFDEYNVSRIVTLLANHSGLPKSTVLSRIFFPIIVPTTMVGFDSYMVHEAELNLGDLRLLKTDMPLFLPKNAHIRLLITSSDVLHS